MARPDAAHVRQASETVGRRTRAAAGDVTLPVWHGHDKRRTSFEGRRSELRPQSVRDRAPRVASYIPAGRERRTDDRAPRPRRAHEMPGVSPHGGAQVSLGIAMPMEARLVLEVATSGEVDDGMAEVVGLLRRASRAARVEWWAPDDEGELRLRVSCGAGDRHPRRFPLGRAGEVVVLGGDCDDRLASAIEAVKPILRRRCVDEQLVASVMRLARRNEALEEFAALVAHELKTPLQEALVADDASSGLERSLDLIDSLIEAARDSREDSCSSAAVCLDQVLADLGPIQAEVTAEIGSSLPLPQVPLRVILRNLLGNAVAADARHVHVVAMRPPGSWRLVVDDDGVGLSDVDGYAAGSGLGLRLCRRIAGRYGGAIELAPRPAGGTRATLQPTRPS